MTLLKKLFSGGNTCLGFHSFYDYISTPDIKRKFILKGGPGVGKSTFMKRVGADFANLKYDLEYHWCSSDSLSLDGLVIGDQTICLLDGTAPHMIDPKYPGAVDEIIDLSKFWDQSAIAPHKKSIIELSRKISLAFNNAYIRLQEANLAYSEWASYVEEAKENSNLASKCPELVELIRNSEPDKPSRLRHHFAAAITPQGIITYPDSLLSPEYQLFLLRGQPGSGIQNFIQFLFRLIAFQNISASIYHSPLNPDNIDILVLDDSKTAIVDGSGYMVDYSIYLQDLSPKEFICFDDYTPQRLKPYENLIRECRSRLNARVAEAINLIKEAKRLHDELENFYIPHMDFDSIENFRIKFSRELISIYGR